MNNKKGRFIVFEGLDGSGKSTQLKVLANTLRGKEMQVYETCEPTDSPIGSLIHQVMTGRINCDHKTIGALFVADRIDHLLNDVNGILKKINDGVIVLSDRYYFSSYSYHGIHIPLEWIIRANSLSAEMLKPDINMFLDLSPSTCVSRLNKERHHLELYENADNLRKVREKYFESFELLKDEENILIVDAEGSPADVSEKIWNSVRKCFPENECQ